MREYSRREIKDTLKWEGGTEDGSDPDYWFDILEQADPKIVATMHQALEDDNWGLARPSHQVSLEPVKPESRRDRKAREAREERRYQRSLPWHFIQD